MATSASLGFQSQSSIMSSTGKTRLRSALERAQNGGEPCIALWLWFPGYSLARLVGGLGADVSLSPTPFKSVPCFSEILFL